jgi:hypothetical protein
VADLLAIVDRDPRDAEGNISADRRFGIACNGALKLCAILLHASGYRPENLQHYRTIAALPLILGEHSFRRIRRERLQSDSLPGRPDLRSRSRFDRNNAGPYLSTPNLLHISCDLYSDLDKLLL